MVDIFALTRKILKSLEYETQDEVKYSLDQFPSRASLVCHHGCTGGKNNFGSKTALFFLETLKETNLSPEPLKAFYHHSPESVLTQHHSLVSNCTEAEREIELPQRVFKICQEIIRLLLPTPRPLRTQSCRNTGGHCTVCPSLQLSSVVPSGRSCRSI